MEEDLTLAIIKEKGIRPSLQDLDSEFERSYRYLKESVLRTPLNSYFKDEVSIIYQLLIVRNKESFGSMFLPTIEELVDMIDEENNEIIHQFCHDQFDNPEESYNAMISIYAEVDQRKMESYVEEALKNLGYPVADKKVNLNINRYDEPYQLLLFSEEEIV